MAWSTVVGQARVKTLLRSLWEAQRLPHAMLFYGPPGAGMDAVGIELARVLNCERGQWDACGVCPSCLSIDTLRHQRLSLIFALPAKAGEKTAYDKFDDGEMAEINSEISLKAANPYHRITIPKAQGIKVQSIRDLRHATAFRAGAKGRNVVLIMDADRMNPNAANALLKTLEEPTGDTILILTSAKRESMLPTILSRCQQVRFEALPAADIERGLLGMYDDITPERAREAAMLAQGNYLDAQILATGDSLIPRSEIREFLLAIHQYNPRTIMKKIGSYGSVKDGKALTAFLTGIASWFRDVLAVQEDAEDAISNIDMKDSIVKFAALYPDADCVTAVTAVEETIDLIAKNVHLVTSLIVLSNRLRRCLAPHLA